MRRSTHETAFLAQRAVAGSWANGRQVGHDGPVMTATTGRTRLAAVPSMVQVAVAFAGYLRAPWR